MRKRNLPLSHIHSHSHTPREGLSFAEGESNWKSQEFLLLPATKLVRRKRCHCLVFGLVITLNQSAFDTGEVVMLLGSLRMCWSQKTVSNNLFQEKQFGSKTAKSRCMLGRNHVETTTLAHFPFANQNISLIIKSTVVLLRVVATLRLVSLLFCSNGYTSGYVTDWLNVWLWAWGWGNKVSLLDRSAKTFVAFLRLPGVVEAQNP